MKKLIAALLLIALLLPAAALADGVVNVYNWFDYIDESVLEQFEEETGIHVNYMNFTTNEDMLVMVEANPGAIDVVFPSEYCVQRLLNKGLLMELDFSRIPNFSQIAANLLDPSYDPGNAHSVPYMWGTLGILYNKELVDEADVSTWGVLWNEKYKGQVLMMDSIRDGMGLALKYLGYSMNSTDYTQLRAATDLLIQQKTSGMVKSYGLDEFKDKMVAGEAALAVVYSGDAQYAIDLDEEGRLAYAIPEEGSNIWVDCAVIPAAARNVDNAYAFIDFLCRPDVARKNVEEIWYCSVNTGAIELLGEEYASLYVLNPSEDIRARLEYYNDLDATWLTVYNTLWQEVKQAN
ncbi:MAG: spermidine/putrescine ABC transporter substrate-binding protein [Clostridia bacterium]|nr:spermidine/putrescine ABC transporter substrate-binding protein [Clostridia bacterium]